MLITYMALSSTASLVDQVPDFRRMGCGAVPVPLALHLASSSRVTSTYFITLFLPYFGRIGDLVDFLMATLCVTVLLGVCPLPWVSLTVRGCTGSPEASGARVAN